jgi:hypothetical protein
MNADGSNPVNLTMNPADDVEPQWAPLLATPEELIEELAVDVTDLVTEGVLKAGQANGLLKPLGNALRSLEKGKTASACSQLQDFIGEVLEKTPTPLDEAHSGELIDAAQAVRSSLGCAG